MPEQFKLLVTLPRATISQTPRRSMIIAARHPQAGTSQSNTRGKVLLKSIKVACDRIESLHPLLCNAEGVVNALDLRGVAEMRPEGEGRRSFAMGAGCTEIVICCGVVWIHPWKRLDIDLHELGAEDSVQRQPAHGKTSSFPGFCGEVQDRSRRSKELTGATFPESNWRFRVLMAEAL